MCIVKLCTSFKKTIEGFCRWFNLLCIDLSNLDNDSGYLKMLLKAEVAKDFWGYDEYYKIIRLHDNQVLEAMKYFNESRLLAAGAEK